MPTLAQLLIKPDNDLALMLLDKGLYGELTEGEPTLPSIRRGD